MKEWPSAPALSDGRRVPVVGSGDNFSPTQKPIIAAFAVDIAGLLMRE
jgi:hypothetical protein